VTLARAAVLAFVLLAACTSVSESVVPMDVVLDVEDGEGTGPTAVLHVTGSSQVAVRGRYCRGPQDCVSQGPPWVNGHLEVSRGSALAVEGDGTIRKSRIGNGTYPKMFETPGDVYEPLDLGEGPAVLDLPPDDYVIRLDVKVPSGVATFFVGITLT
jgi:hypothetical protein